MTDNGGAPSEREEIEMLLPWYATGRLDAADRARVAAWLARDEALGKQLQMIQDERRSAIESAEALPSPSPASIRAAVGRAESTSGKVWDGLRGITDWIDARLARLSPPSLRWAAAAAALIIALQAVGLGFLLDNTESETTYQTASGPPVKSQAGAFVLMQPRQSARIVELDTFLRDLGATIVDGPTLQGLYRVKIGPADLNENRRKEIVDLMRKRSDIFELATPVPAARQNP